MFRKHFLLVLSCLFMLSACSNAQTNTAIQNNPVLAEKKVLIVYLTRTKNTKTVAEILHKIVGGDLVELELTNPYPENYKAHVEQVVKENETDFLPPIKTKIEDFEKYDVVFVGFPTWGMQLPPPIKSFLKQYNFSNKTLVPFNTNAGYGIGSSFETVKSLCPESKILEGFSTQGGKEKDGILFVMKGDKEKTVQTEVQQWLKTILN